MQTSAAMQVYFWRYAIAKRNLSASGLASTLLNAGNDTGLFDALGLAVATLHRMGPRR